MPPPFPCGTPYSPPCPPQPCIKILAKLTPKEQLTLHKHFTRCYKAGRAHEKAEQKAKKAAKKK